MDVGLIGYGAIGSMLARAILDGTAGDITLAAVLDVHEVSPFKGASHEPLYTTDVETFLAQPIELVVEAASQTALRKIGPRTLAAGKSLLAMSTGAFADVGFLEQMRALAIENRCRVYLPSGAVGGLDVLSAAAVDDIESVVLTTTKPPHALEGAGPDGSIDLATVSEPTCIYEGPAIEAVQLFPKNVNVAAAVSLAGIGVHKTQVRIVADPAATRNSHCVEAYGRFGYFKIELNLRPSPDNPRTSYLAVLSAIRTLRNLGEPIVVGG